VVNKVAEKQLKFFGAEEKKEVSKKKTKDSPITKRDIFFMSLLAFVTTGLLFSGVFIIIGSVSGYAVLDFSGEKEVSTDEVAIQEAPPVEEIIEEVVEETTEEETQEDEVPVEEVVAVADDPCGEDIVILEGKDHQYGSKTITAKLVSNFAAQLSVGGSTMLFSVGETQDVNGLKIKIMDTDIIDEGSAAELKKVTLQVVC
jgi:hypothetical protein